MDRRRKKKRVDLEKYLQQLLVRCKEGSFEKSKLDEQVFERIEYIYEAFVDRMQMNGRPLSEGQAKLMEQWSTILGREMPEMKPMKRRAA